MILKVLIHNIAIILFVNELYYRTIRALLLSPVANIQQCPTVDS